MRTRFAPSPTGPLHVGGARTALFNYLFARGAGGAFVVRMEDTDAARSRAEYEGDILDSLAWLGLHWDEGPRRGGPFAPYRQSERLALYRRYAARLLDEGRAYRCYCSEERLKRLRGASLARGVAPRYDGRCRDLPANQAPQGVKPAVRLRVEPAEIRFVDGVHGEMSFDGAHIGDFIIVGSDGAAAYNLAVVIDDASMEITDVIRGDDHLSNTARQLLLFDALGLRRPRYHHIPLVTDRDGRPLSKRRKDLSIPALRRAGHLPEAVVNALARLGWSPGEGLLTLEEMSAAFDTSRLSRSPSVFDTKGLEHYGRLAVAAAGTRRLAAIVSGRFPGADRGLVERTVEALKGEARTVAELEELAAPIIEGGPETDDAADLLDSGQAAAVLRAFADGLRGVEGLKGRRPGDIMDALKRRTALRGKSLFMPLRAALTGRLSGVDVSTLIGIVGAAEALRRVERALRRGNQR